MLRISAVSAMVRKRPRPEVASAVMPRLCVVCASRGPVSGALWITLPRRGRLGARWAGREARRKGRGTWHPSRHPGDDAARSTCACSSDSHSWPHRWSAWSRSSARSTPARRSTRRPRRSARVIASTAASSWSARCRSMAPTVSTSASTTFPPTVSSSCIPCMTGSCCRAPPSVTRRASARRRSCSSSPPRRARPCVRARWWMSGPLPRMPRVAASAPPSCSFRMRWSCASWRTTVSCRRVAARSRCSCRAAGWLACCRPRPRETHSRWCPQASRWAAEMRVALALPLDAEQHLADTAGYHGHEVLIRCSGGDELAVRLPQLAVELVVVQATPEHLTSRLVETADALGIRMLVVADDEEQHRHATRAGIVDAVGGPAGWGLLEGEAAPPEPPAEHEQAAPALALAQPRRAATVVAVWGPHGAPGRTSLAIALAAEFAAAGLRTVLADADTHAASVAPALGLLDEAPGFAAACR